MYQDVIFREYDIRGVYNKEFDKDFAYLLGRAYARYFFEKLGKSRTACRIIGKRKHDHP